MDKLEWKEALRVGVDSIDRQHQAFIDAVNRLFAAVMEGDAQRVRRASIEALGRLATYMEEHFTTEEKLMEEIGYPGLESHRKLHDQFASRIERYLEGVSAGSMALTGDLLQEMLVWFRDHILTEDMKYAAHYRLHKSRGG